ncbi:MAG: PhnD/SsuA/transferrin family substrate-binding protein [Gammaproteobacteria bacterium]|jgi:ABC-type phosphate/phosphonate transport system substrate-binding protein
MTRASISYFNIFGSLVLITKYLFLSTASAELILSAPPREKPDVGESYYAPIAKSLSKILGEPVVYRHPKSWHNYTKSMQAGKYDIVFDGPHFAAWRMSNTNHTAVARLPGHLGFVIMAKKDNAKVNKIEDLVAKKICGLASPNLGTMVVFSIFNNPVIQPDIKIVKGGMKKVMDKFLAGECEYAVVRDTVYKNLPDQAKKDIKIIVHSTPMPNQTITVTKKLDPDKRAKISSFMVSNDGAISASNLLNRFSKKKKYFIPVKTSEYVELEFLLQGVVYGW